jgi:heptose I phosphotransferase
LHRRRRYHKDLYLCHFYLPQTDCEHWDPRQTPSFRERLHLIDLHRLGHHPWNWPTWQLKDLAQLLFSADVSGIEPRDRVLFWRLYRGGGPRSRLLRWAEWCIRLKWLRYRDHNRKLERRSRQQAERKKVAA